MSFKQPGTATGQVMTWRQSPPDLRWYGRTVAATSPMAVQWMGQTSYSPNGVDQLTAGPGLRLSNGMVSIKLMAYYDSAGPALNTLQYTMSGIIPVGMRPTATISRLLGQTNSNWDSQWFGQQRVDLLSNGNVAFYGTSSGASNPVSPRDWVSYQL